MDELSLIRRYEPVLLFSKDGADREENFFPMSVANYLAESALHQREEGLEVERGELTLDHLGKLTPPQSRNLYLSIAADEILSHDPSMRQRLAHGGLALFSIDGDMTPQLVVEEGTDTSFAIDDPGLEQVQDDSELDPSFSFSGPGDPGAAPGGEAESPAEVSFALTDAMQLPDKVHALSLERYEPYRDFQKHPPVYYYHALYNRGYLVLQYWFFYAYNDWGTAHEGVNDHEGDWEMISIFLRNEKPAYIAYSAHTGAPEWHAWDDGKVEMEGGTHPVVYVGCGSHANYFHSQSHATFSIQDFAFGNSEIAIGPGTAVPWGEPDDMGIQPWALNYAGGWGAMVKRFGTAALAAGAQAPVGPVWQFARWESPVGWARIPF